MTAYRLLRELQQPFGCVSFAMLSSTVKGTASPARALSVAPWAACEQQGDRVRVAVVNRAGLVRALIRGDGDPPHTLDSNGRKAYTSASPRRPRVELTNMVRENPPATGLREMKGKILIPGGGLPVKAWEDVIGGSGAGGAPGGDKDGACAQAGIDKIKTRLK